MSRNFPNFLDAYEAWANDGFVPEQFNTWSALSAIAGALERKVWLPWSETFSYYPNIFVLLVSMPGIGKSTALNKSMGLLKELQAKVGTPNILPNQVTEAKFIEMMSNSTSFELGGKQYFQSAGFYWASEASNSFKPVYGDLIPCFTDFYDCPPFWQKATIKGSENSLENVCLSLLAGSTFDYLSKLVTDENILGGFASRLIYVVHREKLVRNQRFQLGGNSGANKQRIDYRNALMADLRQIHSMMGTFHATAEFGTAWEKWYPKFEHERQEIKSERMQSLLVRTNTNVIKVAMLLSAAESNDMQLRIEHWDRALKLVTENSKDLPVIFQEARAADKQSQDGLNSAILSRFRAQPVQAFNELSAALVIFGFNSKFVDSTLLFLQKNGKIKTSGFGAGGSELVKWAGDPADEF